MITCIIIAIIAYCIGSVNFSVILSKKMAGFDVREKGSGNAGTTNMLRTVGKKAAVVTLVCDILKGVVAVLITYLISVTFNTPNPSLLVQIAGIFVIIGHTYPIFFGFKGGKGIATALGVLLIINWKIGLICLVFALVLMAITKIVSIGSIAAAILFPVLTIFMHDNYISGKGTISYVIFAILIALLVIYNHRNNIKRLIEGKENKLSFSK